MLSTLMKFLAQASAQPTAPATNPAAAADTTTGVAAGTFWMPTQASTVAPDVDWLFYFIMYLCYFFFFLIAFLMFWFAWKYRFRKGHEKPAAPASHNTALELLWTFPPLFVVLFIAYQGFADYMNMVVPPANAYNIQVTGRKWSWSFVYPNQTITNELHIPKDVPVLLTITSEDVLHSLFIPAFRLKKDAVPGRFNQFWVQATQAGTFDVNCAEYCGRDHSKMLSKAVVYETPQMFNDWLRDASVWEPKMSFVERGAQLWQQRGCNSCHSVDGTANTGPTWQNLYGSQRQFGNGAESTVADENYIRESIFYPGRRIVQGYTNQMPSYLGQLSENDVLALIWYMRSISQNFDKSQIPTGVAAEAVQGGEGGGGGGATTQPAQ
jgi:cytochrome c oxidase subunit II